MSFDLSKIVGINEDLLAVKQHKDVYPTIDPKVHFDAQTYRNKVVLVTGASRGIGQDTAIAYAKAGASIAIVARSQATLDETAVLIRAAAPNAQVLTLPADVRNWKSADAVVQATLKRFGQLDILIANAGAMSGFGDAIVEKDPDAWWNTFEVNVRGVFNFVRNSASIKPLQKSDAGYIVVVSSSAAQTRLPNASDYSTSKHAVSRFVEFIALEYPELNVFSFHPGGIRTQLSKDSGFVPPEGFEFDQPALPPAATLYLTSGRIDWMSGKYISAAWDFAELERDWKDKVLAKGALVNKLDIPA
ncbi:NAD-P-binding protein [Gloeopeniophorella convolvens]|nr:NAD-P-binding protein [Gloeopeniophorella convolvens]